jgi:hypothetical protein
MKMFNIFVLIMTNKNLLLACPGSIVIAVKHETHFYLTALTEKKKKI